MDEVLVLLYLAAVVAANVSVMVFGPASTPINAFLFVGFDLAVRDRLHDQWERHIKRNMPLLILGGSVLSYILNADTARIATASCVAFAVSEAVKTFGYVLLRHSPRWKRVNAANIPAALADSLLFPTIAFGSFMPQVVIWQFVAKVVGAGIWSAVLYRGLYLDNVRSRRETW